MSSVSTPGGSTRKRTNPPTPTGPERVVLWLDSYVRKNDLHRVFVPRGKGGVIRGAPRIILSSVYRKWRDIVSEERTRLGVGTIQEGAWKITIYTVCDRLRHLGPSVPFGDSDSVLVAVKDALENAGFIDNDGRIVSDETHTLYRKGERGVYVVLERLSGWALDQDPPELAALDKEVREQRRTRGYLVRAAEIENARLKKIPRRRKKAPKPAKKA